MHVHPREHNEKDCQPNHNESDSGDEEEEDLPGLLPSDLLTLPLPLSTTGQSECTEDEAMLESMEDGDETSSSTPEPNQQPELDPEPEQQPEWKEDQNPSRPQRVRHPQKCLHIIHWDSQPSAVSRLVQTLYLDGVIHLSSRPGCYLSISIIHHPVMGLWCISPICR